MVNLIGIYSSAMGSGKSTAATFLCEKYGFKLIKFADPLKEMTRVVIKHMLGGNASEETLQEYVEGVLKEEPICNYGVTPRKLMQTIGTEWGRKTIKDDFWVHITQRKIESALLRGQKVIVDDMRFLNEYETIKRLGGQAWRIVRPSVVYEGGHASEGVLDNVQFDWVFNNEGSIANLLSSVEHTAVPPHAIQK